MSISIHDPALYRRSREWSALVRRTFGKTIYVLTIAFLQFFRETIKSDKTKAIYMNSQLSFMMKNSGKAVNITKNLTLFYLIIQITYFY